MHDGKMDVGTNEIPTLSHAGIPEIATRPAGRHYRIISDAIAASYVPGAQKKPYYARAIGILQRIDKKFGRTHRGVSDLSCRPNLKILEPRMSSNRRKWKPKTDSVGQVQVGNRHMFGTRPFPRGFDASRLEIEFA